MSSWFDRVGPDRPYLVQKERTWTFGEVVSELEARRAKGARRVRPGLDHNSVFDILAGVFGDGAIVGDGLTGDPQGAALVVATSGSSGEPKGVRLSLENLEAASKASAEHLGHNADDRWLLAMSLGHVAGLSILIRQAWTGGSVHLLTSFDPDSTLEAISNGVTMLSLVPTMLHRLLEAGRPPSHRLRAVLVGGGPIPSGLLERAAEAGYPVLPTYGMTETFGQIATLRPDAPLARKAHPLPGVEIRADEDGRIAVRGPQVFTGYLGESDRDGEWFLTSDLGTIGEDGAVRILGRADSVIITGGENVSPEQVEAELVEHPAVDEAVVAGIDDPEWGQRVVCGYSGSVSDQELSRWLGERLPGFMVPKTWIHMESIPKTSIGKPDRAAVSASAKAL